MTRRHLLPVLCLAFGLTVPVLSAPPAGETAGKKGAATAAPKRPGSEGSVELRGRVSGPDGKPIASATVRVVAVSGKDQRMRWSLDADERKPVVVRTEPDGSFRANGLAGESFAVRVEAKDKAPFTTKNVPAGASLTVTLKNSLSLGGRVIDRGSRAPIAGATVEMADPDAATFGSEALRRSRTGEDGRFVIGDLGPGIASLMAYAPSHARMSLSHVPVPTPSSKDGSPGVEPLLMLGPGGRLAGRILLGDAKPAADVSVWVVPRQTDIRSLARSREEFQWRTDDMGRFVFEGVPAGAEYTLRAHKQGYADAESGPHAVEAGTDRQDIEIRLDAGASLKVRVVDAEGKAVAGVEFGMGSDLSISSEKVEAGPEGLYTLRALPPGTFDVRVLPPEYDEVEREAVKLRSGETADLGTVVARATGGISGRVTDRSGEPIADGNVNAYYEIAGKGLRVRTARTKPNGRWRITGVGDGPVMRVNASAKGYAGASQERIMPGGDSVDFVLDRTGSVLGRVLLAEGGSPLAFSVRAELESREEERRGFRRFVIRAEGGGSKTFTDPGGYFRLEDIGPGTYTLIVEADGRPPARRPGMIVTAETDTEAGTIVLQEGKILRGRVLDGRDDTSVAAAVLQASPPRRPTFGSVGPQVGPSAMSGLDGSFTLEGLEAGAYVVTTAHPDFAEAEARVEVPAEGQPAELVVRLSRGGRLEGTVRDASKQPVADERIVLTRGSFGGDMRTAETGADGRYAIERLAPGSYSAMKTTGGSLRMKGMATKAVTIRDGETTILDFGEEPKVRLSGRVLKGSKPVPNATMFFTLGEPLMSGSYAGAESGEDGTYSIGLEKSGTYDVLVRPRAASGGVYGFAPVRLTVPDTPEAHLDIILPAQGISGRVANAEGRPVPDAGVTAARDGVPSTDAGARTFAMTDSNGSYSLEGLPAGTYKVTVTAVGYRTAETYPVIVADAPTPPLDFTLEPGRTVRGRVVDPQDRPIQMALVFAAPSGSTPAMRVPATTDVNGVFVITAPSEGPVDLTALATGWAPARATGIAVGEESEEPSIVLRTSSGGRIRVQVVGAQGQPLTGVGVAFRANPTFLGSEALPFFSRPQPTGRDGITVLSFLAPGTYEVSVPDRRDVPVVQVTVAEGAEAVATLRVP